MTGFEEAKGIYLIGIGGIGMSAIARYFRSSDHYVCGYDRSESNITDELIHEGCGISFDDDINTIPSLFTDNSSRDKILVIYTPAIPVENQIFSWFRNNGYKILKRSEILGGISKSTDTLAVAGTHGKTTVSTMLTHILRRSGTDCSSFLGGISKNYNTNVLIGKGRFTVMEADEFDRSFHRLNPLMAVITAVDADHLDIYGDNETMIEAYNEFCRKIRKGGTLIVNRKIDGNICYPEGLKRFTYGLEPGADFHAENITRDGSSYRFNLKVPGRTVENILFTFPGKINIENAVAAASVAVMAGAGDDGIRDALGTFTGVRRRFDIRIDQPGLTYIDDYAHHPEEIKACITSVREYFGNRRITGIFQPHLFSRTLDHYRGFAEILDTLDEVILLPVYPAREKPVEGVTSELILGEMKLKKKVLLEKNDIPEKLDIRNIDVLLTIGAGDIDRLVGPIENVLRKERKP